MELSGDDCEQRRARAGGFSGTRWSVVLLAGDSQAPEAAAALEKLCRTYWSPIYAFVRRNGHTAEDAQDLTQEFLAQFIARREFARVDPGRGKFRSFLLACLRNALANDWRERHALKRGGGQALLPLDLAEVEHSMSVDAASGMAPERLYDRRWALTVIEQALQRLRQESVEAGKAQIFDALKPFLTDAPADAGYDAVAARLQTSPGAIATALHRLRRRYRELVREALAQTVTTPLELEEEMRYLLEVLA